MFKGELQGVAFNEVIYGRQESIKVLRRRYERPEVKAAVWRRGVAAARGARKEVRLQPVATDFLGERAG